MSGFFGDGKQTTVQQGGSTPYKKSQPIIDTILKDAQRGYKQGIGSDVYTGSTVDPFSRQTEQTYNGITGVANDNMGNRGLGKNFQSIINNGGFNGRQLGALKNMQGQLNDLGKNGLSNDQDAAMANYRQLANGSYDFNANPGAQGVLDASIRDATNAANLNASAAGRYGSGTHEGVLASKIGDLSNTFRYGDYNNWLGRHDAANAGMASLGQQGVQNRQGLASGVFNAGQAGIGNMNAAYQGMMQPYQSKLGVGAAYDDLGNRQMQDQLRIFDAQNNAPLKNMQNYLGLAGLNGQFNQTQTTTQAPGPNPWLQGLGVASTAVGLGGGLGLW